MRYVIVGGVAGGMSAATRLRRLDESAEIIVLERSGHVSFANCGLPYHVGGVIPERSALLLQTPQSLGARFALDVHVRQEVTAVNLAARSVTVRDTATDEHVALNYDTLLLSPGARPVRPRIPGSERAATLRDVEDLDRIIDEIHGPRRATSAVVMGGGFIGLELAENLTRRGIETTIIEATDQVMAPLDPEMAAPVHDHLRANAVQLRLSTSVVEIGDDWVVTDDGEQLSADLVVAAIGVRPESDLARAAGLLVGERGGIVVDEHFRTSDPHVFAVGDAVEKHEALDGSGTLVPLANTANLQGRRAADAMVGRPGRDRPVLGTAIVSVFGLQVATTGWNEKRLRAASRAHRLIHTHPGDHAAYYPGAQSMSLKLLVDAQTDRILGAQGAGPAGVDKRIDVIATAMTAGITASGLAELELAYAPQFGAAKDPVNMLGYIAENLRDSLSRSIQWHEVDEARADGATIVDVRTGSERADGFIPGSLHIPVDELRHRLDEIPPGRLIVHCAVGVRAHVAARLLTQAGRDVRNLDGGYDTWLAGTSTRQPHPAW